jgi:hypothetical protein
MTTDMTEANFSEKLYSSDAQIVAALIPPAIGPYPLLLSTHFLSRSKISSCYKSKAELDFSGKKLKVEDAIIILQH